MTEWIMKQNEVSRLCYVYKLNVYICQRQNKTCGDINSHFKQLVLVVYYNRRHWWEKFLANGESFAKILTFYKHSISKASLPEDRLFCKAGVSKKKEYLS